MPHNLTDPNVAMAKMPQDGPIGSPPECTSTQPTALTEMQKHAVTEVIAGFYKEIAGKWRTTVLVDIWQGPNAVMVGQLSADPMSAGVAKSLISMLDTIIAAKPDTNTQPLRQSGALHALYSLAFASPHRLDLLPYPTLPVTAFSDEEAQAWGRCCISGEVLQDLREPVVVRTSQSVHLFEFAALKQFFRENFKFINPMSRRPIAKEELMRLKSQAAPESAAP